MFFKFAVKLEMCFLLSFSMRMALHLPMEHDVHFKQILMCFLERKNENRY